MVGLLLGLGFLRHYLPAQLPLHVHFRPGGPSSTLWQAHPPFLNLVAWVSTFRPPTSVCAFVIQSNLVWALQGIITPYKALATSIGIVRPSLWSEEEAGLGGRSLRLILGPSHRASTPVSPY